MEMKKEGNENENGRTEIDTRAPFNSVKEAVFLFGETIYATHVKQLGEYDESESRSSTENDWKMREELEETKAKLEKVTEEADLMAKTMLSLKQQLEQSNTQLQSLLLNNPISQEEEEEEEEEKDINHEDGEDKKKNVKFASPSSLTTLISTTHQEKKKNEKVREKFIRNSSTKKRNSLAPFIRWLISKKKQNK